MAIYLEGITPLELKTLIRESVKEEFHAVLNEQTANINGTNDKLLTRKQTCKLLSISLPTLHNWCLKGIIPSYRINTRIRFKKEDIDKILENPRGIKYYRKG